MLRKFINFKTMICILRITKAVDITDTENWC